MNHLFRLVTLPSRAGSDIYKVAFQPETAILNLIYEILCVKTMRALNKTTALQTGVHTGDHGGGADRFTTVFSILKL